MYKFTHATLFSNFSNAVSPGTFALIAGAVVMGAVSTPSARAESPTAAQVAGIIKAMQSNLVRRAPGMPHMGAQPSTPQDFANNSTFRLTTGRRDVLPSSVLLTEFLPPVGNQGSQSSCVGWATAYYDYSYAVARQMRLSPENEAKPKFEFSPAYIYHLGNGGKDAGMTIAKAFEILRDKGCASLDEMPYSDKDFTSAPDEAAENRATRYKAIAVGSLFKGSLLKGPLPDIEALKTFLAEYQQPFTMLIPIFKDFPGGGDFPGGPAASANFVYHLTVQPTQANYEGNHGVTIVGYDNSKHAFRMVNSWGPNWVDHGFIWLGEDFVHDWASDGWACVPGGPSARSVGNLPALIAPHVQLEPPANKRIIRR